MGGTAERLGGVTGEVSPGGGWSALSLAAASVAALSCVIDAEAPLNRELTHIVRSQKSGERTLISLPSPHMSSHCLCPLLLLVLSLSLAGGDTSAGCGAVQRGERSSPVMFGSQRSNAAFDCRCEGQSARRQHRLPPATTDGQQAIQQQRRLHNGAEMRRVGRLGRWRPRPGRAWAGVQCSRSVARPRNGTSSSGCRVVVKTQRGDCSPLASAPSAPSPAAPR